jgi:carboxyl-terminal processing protease
MPQRNLLILLLGCAAGYACYVRGEQNPYARYAGEGLAAIDSGALEAVPDRALFQGAIDGMVDVLRRHGDGHSQFFPEHEAEPMRSEIRQQFGGIGVRIALEGEPPLPAIVAPPDPGTPAARENLLPGDRILSIDGQPTDGMGISDVLRLMRGQAGTTLRLTIQHAHETKSRTVELVRELIDIESVLGDRRGDDGQWQYRLQADPRIAHIRITFFGDHTADELQRVLDRVTADGARAAILDVRDNPGGVLDAAVAICRMFLPEGKLIVETRGRGGELLQQHGSSGNAPYRDLPLAVLVNQESASAAEIVAACFQDHDRAAIVGERTYGKGTVQQLVELESGRSLLKLTSASFWRPSGAPIHRAADANDDATWGVVPDVGFERKLSADEYAVYRKYRSQRDMFRPNAQRDARNDDVEAAPVDLVDEPLSMAVEELQKQLGS